MNYRKKPRIPNEIIDKALKMLETEDISTVSTALRIRKSFLEKLLQEQKVDVEPVDNSAIVENSADPGDTTNADDKPRSSKAKGTPYSYSSEFKAAALAMMEEKGAVATIKELGISSYTLYDWKKKAAGEKKYPALKGPLTGKSRKRYTPEFKAEVIAFYQKNGNRETLQKYGIVGNTLYNWLDEAGIERVGIISDHTAAITQYLEKGPDTVIAEYGITKSTLHGWLKEAGIKPLSSEKYSAEFKEKAVEMTKEKKLTAVAKELGMPASTLATWKMKSNGR